MSLQAIPPDPDPTEEQYGEYFKLFVSGETERMRVEGAKFFWKCHAKKKEPDNFLVPFASWLPEGFYDEYLTTALWRSISDRVLSEANYECACCSARATEVHHRDYRPRVLRGEDLTPLVAICRKCHRRIDNLKGEKSWNAAESLLAELVARKEVRLSKRNTSRQKRRTLYS